MGSPGPFVSPLFHSVEPRILQLRLSFVPSEAIRISPRIKRQLKAMIRGVPCCLPVPATGPNRLGVGC